MDEQAPFAAEVMALIAECNGLTERMAWHRAQEQECADARRQLLFRLNRAEGLTYRDLRDHTGLAWSRLIEEIRRVRDATGAERLPPGRRTIS